MREVGIDASFEIREIKSSPITESELEELRQLAGSYEALFSKRAMKFRSLGLHEKPLSESDYKTHILNEYTFLKRPVAIVDNDIYIGNSKKSVEALKEAIRN